MGESIASSVLPMVFSSLFGADTPEYTQPTLTTLVQPVEEMGLACARTLIDLIKDRGEHLPLPKRSRAPVSVQSVACTETGASPPSISAFWP